MAAPTLSLPTLIPSHRITRKLTKIHPKLLSSLPIHTNLEAPQPKDLCLNPEDQSLLFQLKSASLPLAALALPFLLEPQDAAAVGGEFGILEGRAFSIIHPIVMGGLFLNTLYAGYLGLQWRRVRTIQDEIDELKKQIKPAGGDQPPKPSPLESKIQQLTEERKELIKGSYRDKHFKAGSILLGFGVFEAIYGGVNTWFRSGKLFPGPHLFAGAAITVLWAAAASLVGPMQKGNGTARNLHIALNSLNVLLFVSQIPTGLEMVFKVLESTTWP